MLIDQTYMAENHRLCNGKTSIEITECGEFVFPLSTDHKELLDGVERLLFTLQSDNIGVRDHTLCKLPHRFTKSCREKEHLTVL